MADIIAQVDSISAKLELALISQDWEAVKHLDEQLRSYFEQLDQINRAQSNKPFNTNNMIEVMQNLAITYQKVLEACEQHRAQIQQEMSGIRQGRKGVMAYQGL